MTFTEDLWQKIAPIRQKVETMPFLTELANGTLQQDCFQQYMIQDAIYLTQYSRALSCASALAPEPEAMLFFADAAQTALVVEKALHHSFFEKFGIDKAQALGAEPSPTCAAYTNFLLATAQQASYPVLIAAILPCFWIYKDAGDRIAATARADNPYQAWIDTYSDADFAEATAKAIAFVDAIASKVAQPDRDAMTAVFVRSSQYEWMFWDSAYRLETWPV